jgi:arylesterase/paraoxonase
MVHLLSKIAIVGVIFLAVVYQFLVKSIIFDSLGYGRKVLSINDFDGVTCQKIEELGLEGCEDMWLHEQTGFLYMACSDSQSRTQWLPAFVNLLLAEHPATNKNRVDFLNASARSLTDRIAVLNTRAQGRLASRIQWLSIENFSGINGDGTLNLHGFDIRGDRNTDVLRIILVNRRCWRRISFLFPYLAITDFPVIQIAHRSTP